MCICCLYVCLSIYTYRLCLLFWYLLCFWSLNIYYFFVKCALFWLFFAFIYGYRYYVVMFDLLLFCCDAFYLLYVVWFYCILCCVYACLLLSSFLLSIQIVCLLCGIGKKMCFDFEMCVFYICMCCCWYCVWFDITIT